MHPSVLCVAQSRVVTPLCFMLLLGQEEEVEEEGSAVEPLFSVVQTLFLESLSHCFEKHLGLFHSSRQNKGL